MHNEIALYKYAYKYMLSAFRDPHTGVDFWWQALKGVCKMLHLIQTNCYFLSCFLSLAAKHAYILLRTCTCACRSGLFCACAGSHHTCMYASWMHVKKSYILMCYIHDMYIVHFEYCSLIRFPHTSGYFWSEWMCAVKRGLTVPLRHRNLANTTPQLLADNWHIFLKQ